jgi:hypothetical protein
LAAGWFNIRRVRKWKHHQDAWAILGHWPCPIGSNPNNSAICHKGHARLFQSTFFKQVTGDPRGCISYYHILLWYILILYFF